MVDFKADERLNTLNHSCAHVMAQAVKHLYPQAKFWVGPVVKEGFYYDIDLGDMAVNDEVIAAIEKEMKKICKEGKKIYRREVSKAEALEMFKGDEYKLDLIDGLEDGNITVYDQGDFTDLCRGPHVESTKLCKNFKLIKYSGVYWKGDANNHVMQRIYGVCFPTAEELEAPTCGTSSPSATFCRSNAGFTLSAFTSFVPEIPAVPNAIASIPQVSHFFQFFIYTLQILS